MRVAVLLAVTVAAGLAEILLPCAGYPVDYGEWYACHQQALCVMSTYDRFHFVFYRGLSLFQYYKKTEDPAMMSFVAENMDEPLYNTITKGPFNNTREGKIYAELNLPGRFTKEKLEKIREDNSYLLGLRKHPKTLAYSWHLAQNAIGWNSAAKRSIDASKITKKAKLFVSDAFVSKYNAWDWSLQFDAQFAFNYSIISDLPSTTDWHVNDLYYYYDYIHSNMSLPQPSIPTIDEIVACESAHLDMKGAIRNFAEYVLDQFIYHHYEAIINKYRSYNNKVMFTKKTYPEDPFPVLKTCFTRFFTKYQANTGKEFSGSE